MHRNGQISPRGASGLYGGSERDDRAYQSRVLPLVSCRCLAHHISNLPPRTILYAPFVPFIVIFCHAIAVSSWDDLARLEDFVASLQPNCFLSEAISKLYQLCQVLSNVARLYIEAKEQVQVKEDQDLASVGQEFDVYLSALGLAPMSADDSYGAWASAPVPAGSAPGDARGTMEGQYSGPMPQTSQLGNWFSGNQHMMGLLEEDISLFDPSSWT